MTHTPEHVLQMYGNALRIQKMWFTDKRNGGLVPAGIPEISKSINIFHRDFASVIRGLDPVCPEMNRNIETAAAQPAWVPVAEAPMEWKDGRSVLALHDEFNSTWSVQWVTDKPVNRPGRYDWRDESGWNGKITHLCDCIPTKP